MKLSRSLSFAFSMLCFAGVLITYAGTSAEMGTITSSDEIHGVNGIVFSIERPDIFALTAVYTSDFGLSGTNVNS